MEPEEQIDKPEFKIIKTQVKTRAQKKVIDTIESAGIIIDYENMTLTERYLQPNRKRNYNEMIRSSTRSA